MSATTIIIYHTVDQIMIIILQCTLLAMQMHQYITVVSEGMSTSYTALDRGCI